MLHLIRKIFNAACRFVIARGENFSCRLPKLNVRLCLIFFLTDDQPFLPINPFAEPITTASTTNVNQHGTDEDMIDIDFQSNHNDRANR